MAKFLVGEGCARAACGVPSAPVRLHRRRRVRTMNTIRQRARRLLAEAGYRQRLRHRSFMPIVDRNETEAIIGYLARGRHQSAHALHAGPGARHGPAHGQSGACPSGLGSSSIFDVSARRLAIPRIFASTTCNRDPDVRDLLAHAAILRPIRNVRKRGLCQGARS